MEIDCTNDVCLYMHCQNLGNTSIYIKILGQLNRQDDGVGRIGSQQTETESVVEHKPSPAALLLSSRFF